VLKFTQAPPFWCSPRRSESLSAAVVPAGQSISVALKFAPDQPGTYKGSFGIAGTGGRPDVAVMGAPSDPRRPGSAADRDTIENPHGALAAEGHGSRSGARVSHEACSQGGGWKRRRSRPRCPSRPRPPLLPQWRRLPPPQAMASNKGLTARSMATASPQAVELYGRLATFGGGGVEAIPRFRSNILDPVPAIGVKEAGKDYLVLHWQSPKVEPKSYLVQESFYVVNKATGIPLKSWKNVEGWKPVTADAGTAAARIEGLTPATQYEYRVLGVDNEGKFSPPSDLLQVALPAVSGLPGWVWLFLLGGALALGRRRCAGSRSSARWAFDPSAWDGGYHQLVMSSFVPSLPSSPTDHRS